jgi:hypothetical protein
MRNKVIATNAVIVLLVGLLSFAIVRQAIQSAVSNPATLNARARQDALGATSQLQFVALQAERWLSTRSTDAAIAEVLAKGTSEARGDAATQYCDQLLNASKSNLASGAAMVQLIDATGKVIGRNGTSLSRGEDATSAHPFLKLALAKNTPGSELWTNKERSEQYVVSFSPVRESNGKVIAMLVVGMPLTDVFSQLTAYTSGRGLALATVTGDKVQVEASTGAASEVGAFATGVAAANLVKSATQQGTVFSGTIDGNAVAIAPLASLADGKQASIVALGSVVVVEGLNSAALSVLGVMLLGLLMVVVSGWMLGSYISRPIAVLEEGLLAIINGQEDRRFNLEHPDLGGLAFRIDQLLNKLMGIEEDTSDAEGRLPNSTRAPAPQFRELEDRNAQVDVSSNPEYAAQLAAEESETYYLRIYAEYIEAKKALGEQVAHITEPTFRTRIQGMESEAGQKQGVRIRYHVKATGREVVLVPISLP